MNPLRNPNINYFKGWFFVTFQVAMNKSVFGVISDKKLILNALGEKDGDLSFRPSQVARGLTNSEPSGAIVGCLRSPSESTSVRSRRVVRSIRC